MAIAIDQANLGTALVASGLSISITTGAVVASNGFIVIGLQWFADTANNSVTSVSPGGGLTWTIDKNGSVAGDTGGKRGAWISAQAPSGLASTTTLTVNFVGTFAGNEMMMGASSFTGVKTSSPVDGTPSFWLDQGSISSWTSPSRTIQNGSMLLSMVASENATSHTPTSPSAEAWERADVGNAYTSDVLYRIETTGGTFTNAGAFNTAGSVGAMSIAYLADSAGPAAYARHPSIYNPVPLMSNQRI